MKTIWFSLNKNRTKIFERLMLEEKSLKTMIVNINKGRDNSYINFIREGELDDLDEWVLFTDNWNQNRYLIKLTYDVNNEYINFSVMKGNDRKSLESEIDKINNHLSNITKQLSKKWWGI